VLQRCHALAGDRERERPLVVGRSRSPGVIAYVQRSHRVSASDARVCARSARISWSEKPYVLDADRSPVEADRVAASAATATRAGRSARCARRGSAARTCSGASCSSASGNVGRETCLYASPAVAVPVKCSTITLGFVQLVGVLRRSGRTEYAAILAPAAWTRTESAHWWIVGRRGGERSAARPTIAVGSGADRLAAPAPATDGP